MQRIELGGDSCRCVEKKPIITAFVKLAIPNSSCLDTGVSLILILAQMSCEFVADTCIRWIQYVHMFYLYHCDLIYIGI